MKANSKLNTRSADFTRDTIKIRCMFSGLSAGEANSEKASESAATAEHADKDSIKAKVVVINTKFMGPVNSAFGKVKRFWQYGDGNGFSGTKPWEDGGYRLGLAAEYGSFRQKVDQLIREALDAVRQHIDAKYDEIKKDAETRNVVKLMRDGFPTRQALLDRFGIAVSVDKIASAEDFRFSGLSDSEAKSIAEQREAGLKDMIAESNRGMVAEIVDTVTKLRETLEDAKKRFNGCEEVGYPLVDAVSRMMDRAEKFAFGDAALLAKLAKARKALSEIDMTQAKADPLARKDAAQKAKSLEEDLASF